MKIIRIKKPALFSFRECLWFLDRNLDDCMHTVLEDKVQKLLKIAGDLVLIEISEEGDDLLIKILLGKLRSEKPVLEFVKEWFDLERDISGFYKLLRKDKDLAPLGKLYHGLRLVGIPDFYEVLCWCVIGQQINLTFAYKVKRRLVELYGEKIIYEGRDHFVFPHPEKIASLSIENLRELQLTTRKAEYLIGISQLFVSGELSKAKINSLSTEEEMRQELIKIRGIGEWTANYAVMKGLRGMNCVPFGDSGVNNALFIYKKIPKKNNRREVESFFENFRNWRSYLVYYLWRSLRNAP